MLAEECDKNAHIAGSSAHSVDVKYGMLGESKVRCGWFGCRMNTIVT